MAQITLKGNPIHTVGELPAAGAAAPGFTLVKPDLSTTTLADYKGQTLVLNVFPSVDTPVCATAAKTFNEKAAGLDATILNVSKDLPFAQKRFCGAEEVERAETGSGFRDDCTFGRDYGVQITDGPLQGLYSRAVVVVDGDGKVVYTEQVPEIAQEPDYDAALAALK